MGALSRRLPLAIAAIAAAGALGWAAGCGKLVGLGAPVTPLARIHVRVSGDVETLIPTWAQGRVPVLQAALVWGAQWQPEPLCILPPASNEAKAVLEAGCPDNFGFVPNRVAADTAIGPDGTALFEITSVPAADVMVGDTTARVVYASVLIYDDRNGNGALDLHERGFGGGQGEGGQGEGGPGQQGQGGVPSADAGPAPDQDIIYGASFISMTLPDQRVAFREGAFDTAVAYYPRAGCPDPPLGFSILSTGGFPEAEAMAAALEGRIPRENPASCGAAAPDAATVDVTLRAPDPIRQVGCMQNGAGGTTRYRRAPTRKPDLTHLPWACVPLPVLPGDDAGAGPSKITQLVIAGPPSETCKTLSHFLLKGCYNDPMCTPPSWDDSKAPPAWWPCKVSP